MYADDTVIFFAGSDPYEIEKTLQDDLNRVEKWMKNGRLVLNQRKQRVCCLEPYKS
jgi:hypothetical protein